MNLETFEAAFDRAHTGPDSPTAGPPRLRRRLDAPRRDLAWSALLLVASLAAGLLTTSPVGYLVAAGLVLTVLPDRWARLRAHRKSLAAIESPGDLRALWSTEARRASAGAFTSFLVYGLLGMAFLGTGLVAWLLGRSPVPGLVAGTWAVAWSVVVLLWIFPAASREACLFDEGGETGETGKTGDEAGSHDA